MKWLPVSLFVLLFFYQPVYTAEAPCIAEVKSIYKLFFSSMLEKKEAHKGSTLIIELEKNYRSSRRSERDTMTYCYSDPNRVKIVSRYFSFYSDGKNYILVLPEAQKIAIQKFSKRSSESIANPLEKIKELADLMMTDKNYQRCTEFTDKNGKKCKELELSSTLIDDKYSAITSMRYGIEIGSRSLVSVGVRYKNVVDLKEENYRFTNVNTNYQLPWDMVCPLEEIIYDKNKKLRNEYKQYTLKDMRNKE